MGPGMGQTGLVPSLPQKRRVVRRTGYPSPSLEGRFVGGQPLNLRLRPSDKLETEGCSRAWARNVTTRRPHLWSRGGIVAFRMIGSGDRRSHLRISVRSSGGLARFLRRPSAVAGARPGPKGGSHRFCHHIGY